MFTLMCRVWLQYYGYVYVHKMSSYHQERNCHSTTDEYPAVKGAIWNDFIISLRSYIELVFGLGQIPTLCWSVTG